MWTDRWLGRLRQVRGWVQEWWGQLTDDRSAILRGKSDRILGRLRARHGIREPEARQALEAGLRRRQRGPAVGGLTGTH